MLKLGAHPKLSTPPIGVRMRLMQRTHMLRNRVGSVPLEDMGLPLCDTRE